MKQIKITTSITERNFLTDKYFNDIASIPLINQEKEIELARKIKNGDKQAEQELVIGNLRFVVSCAKIYQNRGLTLEDLIAEGNIGLIRAAQKFDETRGFKFISYAVNWVRQAMTDAIMNYSRIVRLPQNKVLQQNKLRNLITKKNQENGGVLCDVEICEELNISRETYDILLENISSFSLDSPMNSDSDRTFADILANEDCEFDKLFNDISIKKQLSLSFTCLNEIEKKIIFYYFGFEQTSKQMTYAEIGEEVNLTGERIRQLKDAALKKLKYYFIRNLKENNINY